MNIGLIGTAIFDEKQEHTISALLTSPVSDDEYLAAEVTTAILNSLVTLAFVTATVWLLKGVTFTHWALLPPAIIVTTALHAMVGIACLMAQRISPPSCCEVWSTYSWSGCLMYSYCSG